jgi:hypothetical protein
MATTRRTPIVTAASINKVMLMKFPGAASGELPVSPFIRKNRTKAAAGGVNEREDPFEDRNGAQGKSRSMTGTIDP